MSRTLREALAAPEQEPVAYLVEGWHDGKLITHIPHLSLEQAKSSAAVFSQHYTTTKLVPLYAAPAAPVVPLTDSELAKIAVEDEFLLYCDQDSFNEIARAIEAAHGITGASK